MAVAGFAVVGLLWNWAHGSARAEQIDDLAFVLPEGLQAMVTVLEADKRVLVVENGDTAKG